nr:hypothetical protein BgiMline_005959 [Biomphalaria glabrata]
MLRRKDQLLPSVSYYSEGSRSVNEARTSKHYHRRCDRDIIYESEQETPEGGDYHSDSVNWTNGSVNSWTSGFDPTVRKQGFTDRSVDGQSSKWGDGHSGESTGQCSSNGHRTRYDMGYERYTTLDGVLGSEMPHTGYCLDNRDHLYNGTALHHLRNNTVTQPETNGPDIYRNNGHQNTFNSHVSKKPFRTKVTDVNDNEGVTNGNIDLDIPILFYFRRKNTLILRTQLTVRVHAIIGESSSLTYHRLNHLAFIVHVYF